MTAMQPNLPVLVAAPGMTMAEAHAASSAAFRVPGDAEWPCLAQPHGPHRVALKDVQRGFVLPAGRFTVLEGCRGVVFRLRVTPQLGYLGLDDVTRLADEMVETIEKASWLPRLRAPRSQLMKNLREAGGDRAGSWLADEWLAELWVRRPVEKDSGVARLLRLNEDSYLATCIVWDIRLAAAIGG